MSAERETMKNITEWGRDLKTDPSNEMLLGPDGCHYDNAVQAYYFGVLKFCGCGRPEDVLTLLRDALAAYCIADWDEKKGAVDALLPMSCPISLNYKYWLDSLGLIEHGSSVYGSWITDHGKAVLKLLEMHNLEDAMNHD